MKLKCLSSLIASLLVLCACSSPTDPDNNSVNTSEEQNNFSSENGSFTSEPNDQDCAYDVGAHTLAPKKGMHNPKVKSAAARGRQAHKEFAERVKANKGWQSEKTIEGPNGKKLRPDALDPSGRPVELKPNTPSGRRQGAKQIELYKEATGTNGRVIYYDP